MPPTSMHSVTPNGASGNTPQPWIIITLAAAAHNHREREQLQRFREREAWERKVRAIPNSVMSPAGKLVMLDSWAEAQYRRERGIEGLHPIWIDGRKDRVGMSRDSYGDAVSKQLAEAGAVIRKEKPDPRSGNKRVHIEFTDAFWNPELLHREAPRNQGGARKPKCPECRGEQFKPMRWACLGCGTLYDQLPPPGPEDDPEPTPPSGKLPHKVVPQWGGGSKGQVAGWSPEVGDMLDELGAGELLEASAAAGCEGAEIPVDTPTGKLPVGPQERHEVRILETQEGGGEGSGVAGQESETYPGHTPGRAGDVCQACSETSTHGAAAPGDVQQEGGPEASLTSEDDLSVGTSGELREHPQWVAWRPETTPDGRCVKPPYRPSNPRKRADVMDPGTWGTYEEALAVAGEGGGVGYVLTAGDPYSVIDLDGCRDPETGEIEPAAAEVVRLLDSYTEISPSGKGLHVWVRGRIPGERRRSGKLEMYDRARYVTVTGQVLPGYTEIRGRQEELGELYRRAFGDTGGQPRRPRAPEPRHVPIAGDEEIIARVLADPEGRRLWSGDTSLHSNDPSRADLALLNKLARYTGDPERLDRLFRRSGLYRAKWERRDYRERTLARALFGRPRERGGDTHTVDGSVLSDVQSLQEGP